MYSNEPIAFFFLAIPTAYGSPRTRDQIHSYNNIGSLTGCAKWGIKPVLLQRQQQILNPLCHSRNSLAFFF